MLTIYSLQHPNAVPPLREQETITGSHQAIILLIITLDTISPLCQFTYGLNDPIHPSLGIIIISKLTLINKIINFNYLF
jgi:hypothetical protein